MFELLSKQGDRITAAPNDHGFGLYVIPAVPPFDDAVLDVFQLGLKFSSLARLRSTLRSGKPFVTDDARTKILIGGGEATLRFAATHERGKWFDTVLDKRSTDVLLSAIDDTLAGRVAAVSNQGLVPSGAVSVRVGRNAPCPCGSGSKYKKCCERAAVPAMGDVRDTERVKAIIAGVDDAHVLFLENYASQRPSELRSERFWDDLGIALSSVGYHDRALMAFSRGLDLAPTDEPLLSNLAVTYEQLGDIPRALAILETVPAGSPQVAVIRGNVLAAAGRIAEAAPFYEEAIREEPEFDLPYLNLIRCLEQLGDPARELWVERAVHAVRTPAVAAMWARQLFMADRLEELAEADWIDGLRSNAGDNRMLGRRHDDPASIIQAQVWRAVGLLVREPSLATLQHAAALLPAFREVERSCDPARLILQAATELGAVVVVDQAYSLICDDCKKQYGPGGWRARRGFAYAQLQEWNHAVNEFAAAVAAAPDDLPALHGYWWSLDEIGKIEESVTVAEHLRQLRPRDEHINYNLGLLCGKIGLHGKARYYYEEELGVQPEHPYARENLAITLMLEGRLTDAASAFDAWLASTGERWLRDFDAAGVPWEKSSALEQLDGWLTEKQAAFAAAMTFAREHESSDSYRHKLAVFLESAQPRLGSTVTIRTVQIALGDTAALIQATDAASRAELASRYLAEQQGDLSAVVASLHKELPCWSQLPPATHGAITNAEFDLLRAQRREMAMVVVSYGKAVETALKTLVFDPYRDVVAKSEDFETRIQNGLTPAFEKAHAFVRFLRDGRFIELGTMLFALRLLTGRTAQRLDLLGDFLRYVSLDDGSSPLLSPVFLEEGDFVSKHRNAAAHSASFDRTVANEVRDRTLRLLAIISGAAAHRTGRL